MYDGIWEKAHDAGFIKNASVNETKRALAAALGVSVYGAKLYGFMLGASLAALGGSLLAFMQPSILTSQLRLLQTAINERP